MSKKEALNKYFKSFRDSVNVEFSSTHQGSKIYASRKRLTDEDLTDTRSLVAVEPGSQYFDKISSHDEFDVDDGHEDSTNEDVDSTSSSDELEDREAKVNEKVTDAFGNVKIITRTVKETVKVRKAVTYRDEASLISQSTMESGPSSTVSLPTSGIIDEYEVVEEEIEEEIEVEEEEEEEEEGADEDKEQQDAGDASEEDIELRRTTPGTLELSEPLKKELEEDKNKEQDRLFGEEDKIEKESLKEEVETDKSIEMKETKSIKLDQSSVKGKIKKKKVVKKIVKRIIKRKSELPETLVDRGSDEQTVIEEAPKEPLHKVSSGLLAGEHYLPPTVPSGTDKPVIITIVGPKVPSVHQDDDSSFNDVVKSKLIELQNLRRKNKILHKSICQYYKQRNMTYVYQDDVVPAEIVRRYKKKLILLDEIQKSSEEEKKNKTTEMNELQENLDKLDKEYEKQLVGLLHWETERGKDVIDTKTGKPVDEDIFKPLIRRHEYVLKQLSEVRLKLIKFQKHFNTKLQTVKSLTCLEGMNIIDFEKLKMDNQIYNEKIEEREYELSNLRRKMLLILHDYAHILEKADSVQTGIEEFHVSLPVIRSNVNSLRECANKLKVQRDGLRNDTRKIKKEAGLVLQPKLAIDFEESIDKLEDSKIKLQETIRHWNQQRSKIERLRKLINDLNFFN